MRKYRNENGAEVLISLKTERVNGGGLEEALGFMAECSRRFYLDAGNELRSEPDGAAGKADWADGESPETVYRHYGYGPEDRHRCTRGFWPREKLVESLAGLAEFAALEGLDKKKFRIVIDGDPEFPRVLAQVFFQPE